MDKEHLTDEMKDKLSEIISQQKVLNTMLGTGQKLTLKYTERVRRKGILGLFGKKEDVEKVEKFVIGEPTLAVLDRMSAVWLKFELTELEGLIDDSALEASYKIVNRHARDLARVIAIAALGESYFKVQGGDDEELERLTELFYTYSKPSQLRDLAMYVTASANLADFILSMRLMKSAVTTKPTERIE